MRTLGGGSEHGRSDRNLGVHTADRDRLGNKHRARDRLTRLVESDIPTNADTPDTDPDRQGSRLVKITTIRRLATLVLAAPIATVVIGEISIPSASAAPPIQYNHCYANGTTHLKAKFGSAQCSANGKGNLAVASGPNAEAKATTGTGNKATASGSYAYAEAGLGSNNTSTATGPGAYAISGIGNNNTATATGDHAAAVAASGNNNTSTANVGGGYADSGYGNNNTATSNGVCSAIAYGDDKNVSCP